MPTVSTPPAGETQIWEQPWAASIIVAFAYSSAWQTTGFCRRTLPSRAPISSDAGEADRRPAEVHEDALHGGPAAAPVSERAQHADEVGVRSVRRGAEQRARTALGRAVLEVDLDQHRPVEGARLRCGRARGRGCARGSAGRRRVGHGGNAPFAPGEEQRQRGHAGCRDEGCSHLNPGRSDVSMPGGEAGLGAGAGAAVGAGWGAAGGAAGGEEGGEGSACEGGSGAGAAGGGFTPGRSEVSMAPGCTTGSSGGGLGAWGSTGTGRSRGGGSRGSRGSCAAGSLAATAGALEAAGFPLAAGFAEVSGSAFALSAGDERPTNARSTPRRGCTRGSAPSWSSSAFAPLTSPDRARA